MENLTTTIQGKLLGNAARSLPHFCQQNGLFSHPISRLYFRKDFVALGAIALFNSMYFILIFLFLNYLYISPLRKFCNTPSRICTDNFFLLFAKTYIMQLCLQSSIIQICPHLCWVGVNCMIRIAFVSCNITS